MTVEIFGQGLTVNLTPENPDAECNLHSAQYSRERGLLGYGELL